MTNLVELLKKLLRDVVLFVRCTSGIRLRRYQEVVARAVVNSVVHHKGLSFVVIFPRQSGKNELQAQIQAYLLTLLSSERREIVQVSPTWRPQTENAMHRLETVLSSNLIVKDRWEKHYGHIYQVGAARLVFLSGSPAASIVGATANLLLSIDEAQDIQIDKYDKEIAPMAASTNATKVFWGTAWTSNTLLAREEKAAREKEKEDNEKRVWRISCEEVAAEVPAYGKFVSDQVKKLGRNHPMIRTQYYSEDIDAEGGLFDAERLALIYGHHPAQSKPNFGELYVMSLDVAGEDENPLDLERLENPARDATALTIARVNTETIKDPGILLPTYEIVYRQLWVGVKHTDIYGQILNIAATWQVKYLICDATGIGAGLTAFLTKSLGPKVIPFIFSSKTKSDLGWAFLGLIDTGRLKDYAMEKDGSSHLAEIQRIFYEQMIATQYEIVPGPEKKIKWSVPEGTRNIENGELIHDDLVISAAMITIMDERNWTVTGPAAVIKARDPLDDMKGF